jgi:hypothetical protein
MKAQTSAIFRIEQRSNTKKPNKRKYQYSDLVVQPSDMSHLRKPSVIA